MVQTNPYLFFKGKSKSCHSLVSKRMLFPFGMVCV